MTKTKQDKDLSEENAQESLNISERRTNRSSNQEKNISVTKARSLPRRIILYYYYYYTISSLFELETRRWSQVQAEEKIF